MGFRGQEVAIHGLRRQRAVQGGQRTASPQQGGRYHREDWPVPYAALMYRSTACSCSPLTARSWASLNNASVRASPCAPCNCLLEASAPGLLLSPDGVLEQTGVREQALSRPLGPGVVSTEPVVRGKSLGGVVRALPRPRPGDAGREACPRPGARPPEGGSAVTRACAGASVRNRASAKFSWRRRRQERHSG